MLPGVASVNLIRVGRLAMDPNRLPLVVASALGLLVGTFVFPTWQHSVESGQVLAGLVSYPDPQNPFYIYHKESISLINYISAIAAKCFGEMTASILMSALQGGLSYFAIALFLLPFLPNRPALVATLPVLIHASGVAELSSQYPIDIAGAVGYGAIALSSYAICCGLFVNGYLAAAGIAAGLLPALHPTLGAAVVAHLVIAAVILMVLRIRDAASLRPFLYSLALALTVSIFFFYFCLTLGAVASNLSVDASEMLKLSQRFVSSWSNHHRDFDFSTLTGGMFIGYSILLTLVPAAKGLQLDERQRLAIIVVGLAAIGGMIAAVMSHLPTEALPLAFWQAMPVRFPNITIFLAPTICLGLLFLIPGPRNQMKVMLFLVAVTLFRLTQDDLSLAPVLLPLFLLGVTFLLLLRTFVTRSRTDPPVVEVQPCPLDPLHVHLRRLGATVIVVGFAGASFLWIQKIIVQPDRRGNLYEWSKEKAFFDYLAGRDVGYVATAGMELIQLKTRRPILTTHAFNQALYLPSTWIPILEVYKNFYGVQESDLDKFRMGTLFPGIYYSLWERRKYDEWKRLSSAFKVSDIVTYRSWYLDLPLAAQSDRYFDYRADAPYPRTQVVVPPKRGIFNVTNALRSARNTLYFWEAEYPVVLELAYPVPTTLKGYSLLSLNTPERMPADWVVEVSPDAIHWTAIDTMVDQRFGSYEEKVHMFQRPVTSPHVRFTFTRGTEVREPFRVYELRLLGACGRESFEDLVFGTCYPNKVRASE